MSVFSQLSQTALLAILEAIERGRLSAPFSSANLSAYISNPTAEMVSLELNLLVNNGMTSAQLVYLLRCLAAERDRAATLDKTLELVWTSPQVSGADCRDTHVVAMQLLQSARASILLSSYSLDENEKAHELLQAMATQMERTSNFEGQMFLNVKRNYGDRRDGEEVVREFAELFQRKIWPGKVLPKVFYDPRALSLDFSERACLHAKVIVVDRQHVLLTSANFTEASRKRNIEAGVVLSSICLAQSLHAQFERLVGDRFLLPLF